MHSAQHQIEQQLINSKDGRQDSITKGNQKHRQKYKGQLFFDCWVWFTEFSSQ
jgi:hypothetical protein